MVHTCLYAKRDAMKMTSVINLHFMKIIII